MSTYEPTHLSMFDGSDVMFLAFGNVEETVMLVTNENGDEFDALVSEWRAI